VLVALTNKELKIGVMYFRFSCIDYDVGHLTFLTTFINRSTNFHVQA
jgi:hypothetical protein